MKKFLALLLCMATVFTLAGCSLSKTEYYSDFSSDDVITSGNNENSDTNNKDNSKTVDKASSASKDSKSGKNNSEEQVDTDIKGAVGGQTDAKAAEWGIKTDSKGIEKTVNLKGKTVKMAVFNTARYTSSSFQRAVKAFEKKYSCTVKIDKFAFGDEYMTAVRNSVASGNPYDITFIHGAHFYNAIGSNVYQPLNNHLTTADLLDESTLKGIDLNKSVECSWNGKIYGVTNYSGVNPLTIFYNKKKFSQSGLEDPRELYNAGKWTWDKFVQLGLQVTDTSKGTYFGEANFYNTSVASTYGGATIDWSSGTPVANLNNEALIQGYKLVQSFVRGANQVIKLRGGEDQLEDFCNGNTFVYLEESDRYITIMNKMSTLTAFGKKKENLGIVPLPLGGGNTHYPTGWVEVCASPKGSDANIAVAWMKFYSSYKDPVSDKTTFTSEDRTLINNLLKDILPSRCGFNDASVGASQLEGRIIDEIVRGGDISQCISKYQPQFQSCINATLEQLSKIG